VRVTAKQFFYAMIAVIILGFGGIIAAFYWGEGQLNTKAASIADLQSDRDVASDKIIALQKAKKSGDDSVTAQVLLDRLLPTTKSQETLIADVLFTATQEAGIPGDDISAFSFSNTSEDPSKLSGTEPFSDVPGVLSYPFNLSIQNISYTTLLKFLKEVETNGRLVQIDNLQISPDKNAPGLISGVNLTMKAFLEP